MKKQLLLVMLCAGMFCGTEAKGQEAERLSGYVQAERFTKEKLNTMLFSTSVDPHWFRKGSSFWYEYKTVVPRGYTRFLGKLSELADRGVEVHFFTGNHDIWCGDY